MTADLPLFAIPKGMHRIPDAPTSIEAARRVVFKISGMRRRILELMREAGDRGWTDNELRHLPEFAGYSHSTVGKRRTELTQMGYIAAYGTRDGFTVWVIRQEFTTEAGQ